MRFCVSCRGPRCCRSCPCPCPSRPARSVYAVEKNPNAVVTLQNRLVADGWEGTVTIVPADMREWEAPEQADILVRCAAGRWAVWTVLWWMGVTC